MLNDCFSSGEPMTENTQQLLQLLIGRWVRCDASWRFKLGQCDTNNRKHTRITSVTKVTLGAVTGVTPTTGKCTDNDSGYKSDV